MQNKCGRNCMYVVDVSHLRRDPGTNDQGTYDQGTYDECANEPSPYDHYANDIVADKIADCQLAYDQNTHVLDPYSGTDHDTDHETDVAHDSSDNIKTT